MKKIQKVLIEYDDGSKQTIEGDAAILFQARVNSAGVMAGVEVKDEE